MLSLRKRLRFSFIVLLVVFTTIFFQNCGGQFKALDLENIKVAANDQPSTSDDDDNYSEGEDNNNDDDVLPPIVDEEEDTANFGLKGDCQTDDTEALRNFFKKGGLLKKPSGSCYLISDTIFIPSNIEVHGQGKSTLIKMQVPYGSYARPVLDLSGSGSRATANIHLSKFAIDAGGQFMNRPPIKYNGNIGYGNAITVQSSDSTLTDMWIKNSWDNGIGFYQLGCIGDNNPNQQCNGHPLNVTALRIECEKSGIGEGSHMLGACVNALTSRNTLIADSIDRGSSSGFTVDYWGGATATLRNLKTYNNKIAGFWIGTPFVSIENVESHGVQVRPAQLGNETAGHGMVIERFASNRGPLGQVPQVGSLKNFKSTNADRHGLVIAASGWKIENVEIVDPNRLQKNFAAILGLVNLIEVTGVPVGVSNTTVINPQVRSTNSSSSFDYGYDEETRNAGCISIDIQGGQLGGRVAEKSPRAGKSPCGNF